MSRRTFTRQFQKTTGTSVLQWLTHQRLMLASRLLETTDRTVEDIARACGFGTVETMHRAFQRTVRTTPGQYRRLFAVPA